MHCGICEMGLLGWYYFCRSPGPCITNVIATCRKNFSQWESSFLWKLRCHWLKFLRRVAKTLVIQGPGSLHHLLNTLRPRQNGRHFPDDIFKCIFLNESKRILIEISLKFVPKGPIDNIPALVQIMAWRRPGHKPLSEPMLVCLLTHICVTRPQWVNTYVVGYVKHWNEKVVRATALVFIGDVEDKLSPVNIRAVTLATFPFLWIVRKIF